MQLANIRVRSGEKKSHSLFQKNKNGSSLKNLSNVKMQIAKQKRIKQQLAKAAESGKHAKKSMQLELEIKKAFEKIRGLKVHDDLTLLKKAEKRILRKKKKSAELWASKKEETQMAKKERQEKRKENIDKHRGKRKAKGGAEVADETPSNANKLTRKQRRHANLLKYGPKKTRNEREEKRKENQKVMKKQKSKRPNRK